MQYNDIFISHLKLIMNKINTMKKEKLLLLIKRCSELQSKLLIKLSQAGSSPVSINEIINDEPIRKAFNEWVVRVIFLGNVDESEFKLENNVKIKAIIIQKGLHNHVIYEADAEYAPETLFINKTQDSLLNSDEYAILCDSEELSEAKKENLTKILNQFRKNELLKDEFLSIKRH